MKEAFDSAVSYAIALGLMLLNAVLTNSGAIMTIGGILLMGIRLYTDGVKAWDTFKERRKKSDGG